MHKLGLVGRNISHSRSQQVYEKLLGEKVDYTKFDVTDVQEIPRLEDVFVSHEGLSITTPYKSAYVPHVQLVGMAQDLGFINCIRKSSVNTFEGTNTDLLALSDLFDNFLKTHGKDFTIYVLGSGHMANVSTLLLEKQGLKYRQLSRRDGHQLKDYDFTQINEEKVLVLNACSREFVFRGRVDSEVYFWDFNYTFPAHEDYLKPLCHYIDGMELLRRQAEHALNFWGIPTK